MIKRRALGKGLDAIISNTKPQEESKNRILEVDVDLVYPNPFQPRKVFDEEKIEELARSISESGLIQPVVVYESDGKYFLVVGERRLRAVQHLKWDKIPVIVKEFDEDQVAVNALLENIQREDLNAIEVADGLKLLIEKGKITHEVIGNRLGMNRTTVTNYLRLLKLPKKIQDSLVQGQITQGHARTLLSFDDEEKVWGLFQTIVDKNLSVRQAELLTAQVKNEKAEKKRVDPDVSNLEEKLMRFFSSKVRVHFSEKGVGKIEICFGNTSDFERIYNLLTKETSHEQN
jgi:ParB family chromosome partitioning protein